MGLVYITGTGKRYCYERCSRGLLHAYFGGSISMARSTRVIHNNASVGVNVAELAIIPNVALFCRRIPFHMISATSFPVRSVLLAYRALFVGSVRLVRTMSNGSRSRHTKAEYQQQCENDRHSFLHVSFSPLNSLVSH